MSILFGDMKQQTMRLNRVATDIMGYVECGQGEVAAGALLAWIFDGRSGHIRIAVTVDGHDKECEVYLPKMRGGNKTGVIRIKHC